MLPLLLGHGRCKCIAVRARRGSRHAAQVPKSAQPRLSLGGGQSDMNYNHDMVSVVRK
jgi:hypothetical protein